MTSYEAVKRAIKFQTPDRMPVQYNTLGISDTHWVGWNQDGSRYVDGHDIWNCRWERNEMDNMGQVKGHPIADWDDLDAYAFPNPNDPKLYEGMEQQFENSKDKYVMTSIFMLLFERMHSLRGFENTLTDLFLEKEKIAKLADDIVDFDIQIINNISKRFPDKIHGFNFTDDWGTEITTFISPELWDEFFKPRYKKIFDAAKNAGWTVHMHSCGQVSGIIDSLIEIGVDALNLQQPLVFGIEEFGKRFAGRVAFEVTCDIQHTLPYKSDEEIEAEAKLLIENWGTDAGGLILSEYGDGGAIGVPKEKSKVMYDAFIKYDRWKKAIQK